MRSGKVSGADQAARELERKRKALAALREKIARLFKEERRLAAEVEVLQRFGTWDFSMADRSDGNLVVLSKAENNLPPDGTVLRRAAEMLLLHGGPLHVEELLQRLSAVGVKVSKASLTASLDRRAREGRGFQRELNVPNTFFFDPKSEEVPAKSRGQRGRRRPR